MFVLARPYRGVRQHQILEMTKGNAGFHLQNCFSKLLPNAQESKGREPVMESILSRSLGPSPTTVTVPAGISV